MPDPTPDYLLADKPTGIPTHAPAPDREGFCEYLSRRRNERLWVCHRLDAATSGALVLARSAAAARHLSGLFAANAVRKTYLLVSSTPQIPPQTEVHSRIQRTANGYTSQPLAEAAETSGYAHTRFTYLKSLGPYALWQATPHSGRPHQIRLHARDLGIPVLGDSLYGGRPFPRLMLHAAELAFAAADGTAVVHRSELPCLFEEDHLLEDPEYAAWLDALDRRQRLFALAPDTTLRLLHTEVDGLRCDRLGPVCWFYWYRPQPPDPTDTKRIADFSRRAGTPHWKVRHMHNRGRAPNQDTATDQDTDPNQDTASKPPHRWTAAEGDLRYHFRDDQGLSPGLFLDQRANRAWVRRQATGLDVLNLFCYTGGFSLAAAAGKASRVVSVDTSRRTLDWVRDNLHLNDFDPDDPVFEFAAVDARLFLKGCRKRGRRFDLIVCDPPSFARNKDGVFRIQRDLPGLARAAYDLLNPDGRLLFCCNYEDWSPENFADRIKDALPDAALDAAPPADWDYELPGTPPAMKSVVIQRLR